MFKNKLYKEFEDQGYAFSRIILAQGVLIPKVYHLENAEDWACINPTVVVNGNYQITHGTAVTKKTVELLKQFIDTIAKSDGKFCD